MAHATLMKFGYPDSCLWEDAHWAVLLRPQQVTLGAVVLCSKSNAISFSELPDQAFLALGGVTRSIENCLSKFRKFDKINYLALMMVDPHVHFHVIPRYAVSQVWENETYADGGWPGVPDLKTFVAPNPSAAALLTATLRKLAKEHA